MAESSKKGGNKAKVKCFSLGDLVFAKVKERLAMIRQQRTEAAKKREEEKADIKSNPLEGVRWQHDDRREMDQSDVQVYVEKGIMNFIRM
ncbi:hypothetical protein V6N13_044571 [Hibiscus sabdariffa]|uniref:Uncharacterized protein n=1 Tax=Hibiscus sabdariffa TaxID=183260 RepID=A0ABR2RII8_9ROSI